MFDTIAKVADAVQKLIRKSNVNLLGIAYDSRTMTYKPDIFSVVVY